MPNRAIYGIVAVATLFAASAASAGEWSTSREMGREQRRIDRNLFVNEAEAMKVLANDFDVPPEQIHALLYQGNSWGEITLLLATADMLHQEHQSQYRTRDSAVAQIGSLRDAGLRWGQVLEDLRLKSAPILVAAERARLGILGEPRDPPGRPVDVATAIHSAPHSSRSDGPIVPEKGARPEAVERPFRPEKIDRPDHPEKLDRPDRPEKIDRPDRPEKLDRPEKIDLPEKPEVIEKPEKPEKPDRPGRRD
jgi:hypothetical protein